MSARVVLSEGRLDFKPRTVELPDAAGPWRAVWSVRLAVRPGRSRLFEIGETVALVNAPTGITTLGDVPPNGDRLLSEGLITARRGVEGGALLIDQDGGLYRWTPGASPTSPVWETGADGTRVEAVALAGGRLLVQRPRGGAMRGLLETVGAAWVTELVEPGVGVRWHAGGDLRGVLPWEDGLFVVRAERPAVACLSVDDGAKRWERTIAAGVSALVAVVEGRLWLTTYEGEVLALDCANGEVGVRLRLPQVAVPDGVVDNSGRYHLCTHTTWVVLDLAANGATLASLALVEAQEGPSLVFGGSAIPTADGRLVFFDRNGSIFAAAAGRLPNLTLLWRSRVPLLDCRAAHGMLYVLDGDGVLSALCP